MGAGAALGAECVEKREGVPLDSLPSTRGQAGGREVSPGQMLRARAWSSGLGPPPPSLGSRKKSSLIGSLAVSFTLNIKVKQKSQASLCWQREGKAVSSGASLSRNCLPSPLPAGPPQRGAVCGRRPTPRPRSCVAPAGAPAGPARAHAPQPRRHSAWQSKHASAGQGVNPDAQPGPLLPAQYCSLD